MSYKHKAVFLGKVMALRYTAFEKRFNFYSEKIPMYYGIPSIVTSYEEVDTEEIFKCEFEKPPIKIGEKIYINEMNLVAVVKDRYRSTNGEYIYKLDYISKKIEDGESAKQKEKAEKHLKQMIEEYENYEQRTKRKKQQEQKESQPKKRKWFFFKKK